jgi:hypothetical protein
VVDGRSDAAAVVLKVVLPAALARALPVQPVQQRAVRCLRVLARRLMELELELLAPLDELAKALEARELIVKARHEVIRLLVVRARLAHAFLFTRPEGDARRVRVLGLWRRPELAHERHRKVLAPLEPPTVGDVDDGRVGHERGEPALQYRELRHLQRRRDGLFEAVDDFLEDSLLDRRPRVALLALV